MPNSTHNSAGNVLRRLRPKPSGQGDLVGSLDLTDRSDVHAGNPHTQRCPILPKRQRKPPNPERGRAVQRGAGPSRLPTQRRNEDDVPPPPVDHASAHQPSKRERRPQVDVEHPVQVVQAVVGQRPAPTDSRSENEKIDVTSSLHQAPKVAPKIGNHGPPLDLLGKRLEHVPPPPSHHERTPFAPQPPGNSLPEPPGGPGDKSRPTTNLHGGMVIATPDTPIRTARVQPRTTSSRTPQARTKPSQTAEEHKESPKPGDS